LLGIGEQVVAMAVVVGHEGAYGSHVRVSAVGRADSPGDDLPPP
jgi:hypothetical protein